MAVPPSPSHRASLAALCAVIALAAGFRLWRLDAVPPGLFGDEAADGVVAQEILAGSRWPLFVEEPEATKWGSREPLYHYLMAAVFAVGGATPTTLRLTSALLGIATVALLYRLGLRVFGPRVALLGAALLAVSRWHVTISRLGVRAVLAPLWMVLAALALVNLLERRRRRDAVVLGGVLGLGLYTYPAVWAVPVALLVPVAVAALSRRGAEVRRCGGADLDPTSAPPDLRTSAPVRLHLRLAAIALAAGLLVAAPLLAYAALKPDYFFARAARTAGAERPPLRDNLQRVLFMLHFRGDTNPRHNLPGAPMLDPVSGGLCALGLLVALRRVGADPARYGGLLACAAVPLLPSAFSDAAPHGLRAAAALPAVATLAAVGLDRLAPRGRGGAAGCLAVLALIGGWNSRDYFRRWASDPAVGAAFNRDAVEFFRFSAGLAAAHDVYALPAIYDAPQWRFLGLAPDSSWHALEAGALVAGASRRDRVLISDRPALNALIEAVYPEAEVVVRFAVEGQRPGRVYRIRRERLRAELTDDERRALATALGEP